MTLSYMEFECQLCKKRFPKHSRCNRRLFCDDCKLVQTDSVINPDVLFKDYRYLSSVGLSNHFKELAQVLDNKFQIKDKKILEIGCNDGVLLEPLTKLGADAVGVDPASNVIKLARDKGLNVIEDYFNYGNPINFLSLIE